MPFVLSDLPEVALAGLNQLHAEEVVMINELAALAKARDERFDALLDEFVEHLDKHFGIEQTNMERTAYENTAAHLSEHEGIRERLQALRQRSVGLDDDFDAWFQFFDDELPTWLIAHVGEHDTPTALHVAAQS